jgi:hypothetical protein
LSSPSQKGLGSDRWVDCSPAKPVSLPNVAKKAVWKSADDKALVECLKQQQLEGNQSDNGFKPVAWTAAAFALKGSEKQSGGALKSVKSCKDHFKTVSFCQLLIVIFVSCPLICA